MLSREDELAILNGAYAKTRDGRKARFIGYSTQGDLELAFVVLHEDKVRYFCTTESLSIIFVNKNNFKAIPSTMEDHKNDIVGLWEAEEAVEVEPFDLTRALNGEPVALRNGLKAYVIGLVPNPNIKYHDLLGYCETPSGNCHRSWYKTGLSYDEYNIVAMWHEPKRPTVTLTLPCPLKAPQEGMWYIDDVSHALKSGWKSPEDTNNFIQRGLNEGRYFATKEDAQAWMDALRDNRK